MMDRHQQIATLINELTYAEMTDFAAAIRDHLMDIDGHQDLWTVCYVLKTWADNTLEQPE